MGALHPTDVSASLASLNMFCVEMFLSLEDGGLLLFLSLLVVGVLGDFKDVGFEAIVVVISSAKKGCLLDCNRTRGRVGCEGL